MTVLFHPKEPVRPGAGESDFVYTEDSPLKLLGRGRSSKNTSPVPCSDLADPVDVICHPFAPKLHGFRAFYILLDKHPRTARTIHDQLRVLNVLSVLKMSACISPYTHTTLLPCCNQLICSTWHSMQAPSISGTLHQRGYRRGRRQRKCSKSART